MMTRWKYFLIISILLNVLLIGILIGRASSPFFSHFPRPPGFMHDKDSLLRKLMKSTMKDNLSLDRQIIDTKQQINDVLKTKTIDINRYHDLAKQLATLQNQKFIHMTDKLYETASKMPYQKRLKLIDELEALPHPPFFHHGSK